MTRDWYMTAAQGWRWTPKNGGKTVVLEKGVWANGRWLNPDEIEALKQQEE